MCCSGQQTKRNPHKKSSDQIEDVGKNEHKVKFIPSHPNLVVIFLFDGCCH